MKRVKLDSVQTCCLCGFSCRRSESLMQTLYGQKVCYECIIKHEGLNDLREVILQKVKTFVRRDDDTHSIHDP
jgi:hypothetical protein